jgi:peroxiredoxin Q/BCP
MRQTSVKMAISSLLVLSCATLGGCNKADSPTPVASASASLSSGTPAPSSSAAAATSADPAAATAVANGDVQVGKPPPDFSATAQDGTAIHLAALKGKPVVVYFYPKDETPGCTKEACSFRDAWDALHTKGVVLIGISADTDDSHRAFAANHKLPFLLVSDPKGELAAKFGVPVHMGYDARQSFVIGADGNVKKIYRDVDVTVHAKEIAGDLS